MSVIFINPFIHGTAEPPFNVGDIPDLAIWLDAGVGVTEGGGVVTQWLDQSSNGYEIIPSEFALSPILSTNVINGRSVVSFSGGETLQCQEYSGPGGDGFTVFAVVNGSNYQSLYRTQGVGFLVYPWASGSGDDLFIIQPDGFTSGLDTGLVNNEWNIGCGRWERDTTNGFQTFNNGDLVAQRDSADVELTANPLFLGSYDGGSEFMDADLAELIVVHRAVSDIEREQVENYLQTKYAL